MSSIIYRQIEPFETAAVHRGGSHVILLDQAFANELLYNRKVRRLKHIKFDRFERYC